MIAHKVKKVSKAKGPGFRILSPNRHKSLGAGDLGSTLHLRACSSMSPTGDLRHRRAWRSTMRPWWRKAYARWLLGEDGGCIFEGEELRVGRREEYQAGETFPAAPKDTALAVRRPFRPPTVSARRGLWGPRAVALRHFRARPLRAWGHRRGQVARESRTGICGARRGRRGSQRRDFGEEETVRPPRPSRHGETARRDAKFWGRKRVGMGVRLWGLPRRGLEKFLGIRRNSWRVRLDAF